MQRVLAEGQAPEQTDRREPQSPRAERRPAFLTHVHLEIHLLQPLTHASPDRVGVCILPEVLTETALGGDHGLREAGLLQLTPAGPRVCTLHARGCAVIL